MKKIVVTGGLGFIGSNLVKRLCQKNYFVIIVDKKNYSSNIDNLKDIPKKKFILKNFDIINKSKFFNLLLEHKPNAIFNLAAETHVDRSIDNPGKFINSNIVGVYSILEAFKKYLNLTKQKSKLIHISTDEVYGDIKKNSFSKECDAYNPSSPYAASKASSDHLIGSYFRTYGLPVIIANCSNNYGPKQFPEKLIPKIITSILHNEDLQLYGRGNNQREWIFVDDHCEALVKILVNGKIGNKYNIGSGEILNNKQICKLILNFMKNNKKINTSSKVVYVKDRPGHDKRYALNSSKLKKELSWKTKFKIKEGLAKTIDWYLNNQKWVASINKKKYKKRMGL